jgi:hypothetical protein
MNKKAIQDGGLQNSKTKRVTVNQQEAKGAVVAVVGF